MVSAKRRDMGLESTKRLQNARKALRPSATILLLGLFLIGLGLRLPGLMFNGMRDLDEITFEWGCGVRELGLAAAFNENYGIFSYALYGICVTLAEQLPRYWWAPYKLMEISFEAAVLLALYTLLPAGRKHLALLTYWINPWFILHGAWQGFWDGPHTLLALIAVICLGWVRRVRLSWFLAGISLMASAMFKPQGLVHFVMPLGVYLGLQLLVNRRSPFVWFALGLLSALTLITVLLVAGGGDVLAIPSNYLTAARAMPKLCNDCINIWRPITRILQAVLGQSGRPTYRLWLPGSLYPLLHLLAFSAASALIVVFSLRIPLTQERQMSCSKAQLTLFVRIAGLVTLLLCTILLVMTMSPGQDAWIVAAHQSPRYALTLGMLSLIGGVAVFAASQIADLARRVLRAIEGISQPSVAGTSRQALSPHLGVLLILAFSSLVIAQVGTRAHIHHAYAGLVLLIPLAMASRRILLPWAAMVGIHFYSHLAVYQLGRSIVLPQWFIDYPPAQSLISQINAALAGRTYDPLLQFQSSVNQLLTHYLPQEPIISLLSAAQFICFLIIVHEMFALTARPMSSAILDSGLGRPAEL